MFRKGSFYNVDTEVTEFTTHIFGICKVKVNWSRYSPGVTQRVGRGIDLLFHDRSTRRGYEWSAARPGRTLPPGKTRYSFYNFWNTCLPKFPTATSVYCSHGWHNRPSDKLTLHSDEQNSSSIHDIFQPPSGHCLRAKSLSTWITVQQDVTVYINGQLIALFIIFFNISHIVFHI